MMYEINNKRMTGWESNRSTVVSFVGLVKWTFEWTMKGEVEVTLWN